MKSNAVIIRQIGDIRANNNILWMRLLEIAIEHAPADAKTALHQININDRAISGLLAELLK